VRDRWFRHGSYCYAAAVIRSSSCFAVIPAVAQTERFSHRTAYRTGSGDEGA
jgi:hypothetical protein